MKKILPLLLCLLWLTDCNSGKSEPEKVAWGFLHAYYGNDYESAMQYADEETKAELEYTFQQLRQEGLSAAQIKAMAQPVIIEVEGIIANDGYRAVCAYKLKNSPNDYNAMMESLLLNKTDAGWKVSF